jgi:putative SOS response-associated peptidase YedK
LQVRQGVLAPIVAFEPWLTGEAGLELLKPAPNDALQRWPVSQRVNSSRAPDDDQTLIDRVSKGDGEPALASPPSLF